MTHLMTPCAPHVGQSIGSPSRASAAPFTFINWLDARTVPPAMVLAPAVMWYRFWVIDLLVKVNIPSYPEQERSILRKCK